jgi:hypothetical protein
VTPLLPSDSGLSFGFDDRVQAVAKRGFTKRQARFLTTVMLHTGVCVPRQYARFCGIVQGAKTQKFFARLVRDGYASMYDTRHNRARIYHLKNGALYAAIGEADCGFRRRLTLNRAIQRLMVLDAIVEDPDLVWLATAEDKAANLTALTAIAPADLPHATTGEGDARTVRYFPERLPIGLHPAGRGVLVYAFSTPDLDAFRLFVARHAAVLRALPVWTLRVVAPPHLPGIGARARMVAEDELMQPMRTVTIDEMRWYFEQCRASAPSDVERFNRCRRAFSSPRSQVIYRLWKHDGEAALATAGSETIRKAVEAGFGRIEVLDLGHRYGHLSPLAAVS